MTTDLSASQPLLSISSNSESTSPASETIAQKSTRYKAFYRCCKGEVETFLESKAQHYTVLALVSFDLLGIFADIIINLYQCDAKNTDLVWDDVRNGLGIAGLVFSVMFLLELMLSIWAFGWSYFNSSFRTLDAIVILAGLIIDVLLHGILEEVASLVVILRLWRFFKIIEEFSVGAEEQMDGLELRIEQLETENADLKAELRKQKGMIDEEEEIGLETGNERNGSASGDGPGLWQG